MTIHLALRNGTKTIRVIQTADGYRAQAVSRYTRGWRGVCPVCGDEIMGEAVLVGMGDRDDQWVHEECAREDGDDANDTGTGGKHCGTRTDGRRFDAIDA